MVDYDGSGLIYNQQFDHNHVLSYNLNQTITTTNMGDSTNAVAGSLSGSGENQVMVLGKSSGKVFIYRAVSSGQFTYNETLTNPQNAITFTSIAGDILAVSENGCCVYLYKDSGTAFALIQTINLGSNMARKAKLIKSNWYSISDGS